MWPKSRRRYRSVMGIDSLPQIVRACDSLEAGYSKKGQSLSRLRLVAVQDQVCDQQLQTVRVDRDRAS